MIRVGLIGYGYAGRTFHAPLIRATPGLELVAVSSTRPDRVTADLPRVDVVPTALELLTRPSVDLVVVAAPPDVHAPLAAAALRAGKHVVVDKPIAPNLEEARDTAALARSSPQVLAVFQNRRWDGDFLALTDLLSRGVLGEVSHFESHFDRHRPTVRDRWREQPGAGAGLWHDLGPHLVDQALQLFGLPDRVVASLAAQRAGAVVDDWAHVILEYNRLRVILHASVLAAAPTPRFLVHGRDGSWIKYGLDAQESQLIAALATGDPAAAVVAEHAVVIDGSSGAQNQSALPPGNYPAFYAAVRNAIDGAGDNPVPPEQAVAVAAVIDAAIRSSAEGRAVAVPLTPTERLEFSSRGGSS
jgi:predicted dehydrogenase